MLLGSRVVTGHKTCHTENADAMLICYVCIVVINNLGSFYRILVGFWTIYPVMFRLNI